jgi:hypothetical protein
MEPHCLFGTNLFELGNKRRAVEQLLDEGDNQCLGKGSEYTMCGIAPLRSPLSSLRALV